MKGEPLPARPSFSFLLVLTAPCTPGALCPGVLSVSRYRYPVRTPAPRVMPDIPMAIIWTPIPVMLRVTTAVVWRGFMMPVIDHWRRSYDDRCVMMAVPQRNAEAHVRTRLRRGR